MEEAQWFYEDFIRPLDPELPSLNLRSFCLRIFQHCPLLSGFSLYHHTAAFSEFLAYKTRVPVRGAILLNNDMDQVILVKGWKKSANWSFPRGKINKDEGDLDCAIREVYEETGFHVRDAGLVGDNDDMKYFDVTMREQQMRLYVFPGIPMDAQFAPRTRKEISKIQWYKLSELPTLKKQKQQQGQNEDLAITANKFYMVAPFMVPLKKWISQQKKLVKSRQHNKSLVHSEGIDLNGNTLNNQSPMNCLSNTLGSNEGEVTACPLGQDVREESISELPEVSEAPTSTPDPAAELRSILKVPPRETMEPPKPATSKVSTSLKSSALLALLKAGSAPQSENAPPTPLDQVMGSTKTPATPNDHRHHLQYPQGLQAAPPYFRPTFIDQAAYVSKENPGLDINKQSHQRTINSNHALIWSKPSRSIAINAQQPEVAQTNVPPYKLTGDPEFAQNPHIPSMGTSSIPQASKIPPPKLTTHSSLLLSLFKNPQSTAAVASESSRKGQGSNPGPGAVSVEGIYSTVSRRELSYAASAENPMLSAARPLTTELAEKTSPKPESLTRSGCLPEKRSSQHECVGESHPIPKTQQTAMRPPDSEVPLCKTEAIETNAPAVANSEHIKSLLDLFRKPSLSTAERPAAFASTSLELPSTLAELSASPSPGHSREPSYDNTRPSTDDPGLHDITKHANLAHKQVSTDFKPKLAPVFATLNGPLNFPTFEVLVNASKESRDISHTNNLTHTVDPSHPIMESPRASFQKVPVKPDQSSRGTPLVANARKSGVQPPAKGETGDTRLSTPRISGKPSDDAASLQDPVAPRGSQFIPVPRPSPIDEPQGNHHRDHKETLLSLFTKSSHATGRKAFEASTSISPLPGGSKLDHDSSHPPSPFTARSRMGSITSAMGDHNTHESNEKRLPRTTPVNRSLLLGYLDGVVKNERGDVIY